MRPVSAAEAPRSPAPDQATIQQRIPAPLEYTIARWQIEDGLPQITVKEILQTRDGFLWLGTYNGLSRFDGVRFTVFGLNNTRELVSDDVNAFYEDKDGRLWIATSEAGVVRYWAGRFQTFGPAQGLTDLDVRAICEDQDGTLWAGTSDDLFRLEGERFVPFSGAEPPKRIVSLRLGHNGALWIAGRYGLWSLNKGQLSARLGSTNLPIRGMELDADGNLLLSFDRRGGVARLAQNDPSAEPVQVIPFSVNTVYRAPNGTIWLGTSAAEVYCLPAGSTNCIKVATLQGTSIHELHEDREGNLWVGVGAGGLYRLRKKQLHTIGTAEGLPTKEATGIMQDRSSRVWIATWGSGVCVQQGERFERMSLSNILNVTSICENRDGTVWVGSFGRDLLQLSRGEITNDTNRLTGIRVLFPDRQGRLWVGTYRNGIEMHHDGRAIKWTTAEGLSSDVIFAIAQDPEGAIWIGTHNGLNRIRDGKIQAWFRKDGLPINALRDLCVDSQGTLWIGTAGAGIVRFRHNRFTTISTRHGLANDTVSAIVEDDAGHLWLGCNIGIMRITLKALNDCADGVAASVDCATFKSEDGIELPVFGTGFQRSSMKSRDGRVWFCSGAGVVVIDPAQIETNPPAPPVFIDELQVDDQVQSIYIPGQPPSRTQIPPGSGRLEFRYTGLNLAAPGKVRFQYKLEGYDRDWINAGTQRRAAYTHVAPGNYTFRVKAASNGGLWNETGALLPLRINPFFWQTAVFQIAVALALLGGTAFAVRTIILRTHRRKMEALERAHALEKERTRIARDMHDGLGSSVVKIAMLGELVEAQLKNPDGARVQVQKLTDVAREVVRQMDEVVWTINPKNDTVENFAGYLSHIAREHFADTGIECHLEMPAAFPDRPLTSEVRHHLFMAAKEALNNVVKHAHASEVWVCLRLEGGGLEITIRDNGDGCPPRTLERRGSGRANMPERLAQIGGSLDFNSQPGKGTTVIMRVPVN